jgi:raffinose/stachyose/melibiose transport system permease protein
LNVLLSGEVRSGAGAVRDTFIYALLLLFSLLLFLPMVWVAYSAFKTNPEIFLNAWSPPAALNFAGFVEGWRDAVMGRTLLNTLLVVGVSMVLILLLSLPAAFAFARLRFRGRGLFFVLFLSGLMIPVQSTVIPLYALFHRWGWLDTYQSVILPYAALGLPSAIFLMRAYFLTLPRELEESGRIDGCSRFGVFTRIYLPLVQPGVATVVIFVSVILFNELLLGMLFLTSDERKTLPVMLYSFFGKHFSNYQMMFCTLTMIILPLIIVFFLFQRQFVEGLTAGALKE